MNLEKKITVGINKEKPTFLKIQKIKQKTTPNKEKNEISSENDKNDTKNKNDGNKIEEEKNEENLKANNIKEKEMDETEKTPENLFFEEFGFTSLIEQIIEVKKPIIGHFPILDLFFIYDSFIDELPNDYVTFASEISKLFPVIYDTKFLAKSFENHIMIRNSLEELYFDVFEHEKALKPFHNVIMDEGYLFSINFLIFYNNR